MKKVENLRNKRLWYFYVVLAFVLVVITFTPLILSPGRMRPMFLSLPYTLWSSMLISIILVILTYLASRVRNKD